MIRRLICDAAQVRAIQAGATQIRVPCRVQPTEDAEYFGGIVIKTKRKTTSVKSFNMGAYADAAPFAPGDVLSVREAWWAEETTGVRAMDTQGRDSNWVENQYLSAATHRFIAYREAWGDKMPPGCTRWRSASTMPEWAVRLKRTVLSVRCERESEATDADAIACGCGDTIIHGRAFPPSCTEMFQWERRYGKRHPWDTSWCWVLGIEGATR